MATVSCLWTSIASLAHFELEATSERDAPDFDAVIALGAHHIEPARQAAAMAAARTAVEAVPGACWIEVEHDVAYPPTLRPVTVYPHGR